jgi:uncharacterized membrane protein YbjE (DUF340 family)
MFIAFLAAGILSGVYEWLPAVLTESRLSFYALCLLMFCVGVSIGKNPDIAASFRSLNPRVAFLPLTTAIGTLTGVAVVSLLLPHRSLADCLAVGAGFGYYSLSSIFITEYKGAELGTIALTANILREVFALLLPPLLVRYFGKLAPISVGGATTMDTTLPVITRYSGEEYLIVSLYHGFVMDFSVPFLVTLFCSV